MHQLKSPGASSASQNPAKEKRLLSEISATSAHESFILFSLESH